MNEGSTKTPEELLSTVCNRETFIEFVRALIADRQSAEELERAEPERYQSGGARNWQNGCISAFLGGATFCFADQEWATSTARPSWRDFAEFLYIGKVYES